MNEQSYEAAKRACAVARSALNEAEQADDNLFPSPGGAECNHARVEVQTVIYQNTSFDLEKEKVGEDYAPTIPEATGWVWCELCQNWLVPKEMGRELTNKEKKVVQKALQLAALEGFIVPEELLEED